MKRQHITWPRIIFIWVLVLVLIGCESPTDKRLYSELKLSKKVTLEYYKWKITDEGRALISMTIAAKKELARKIRAERIGMDAVEKEEEKERLKEEERKRQREEERKRQREVSKKAENQPEAEIEVEGKPVIHKKYKKEEIDINRIKWTTHNRQESW